jgi:hypothetical protein
MTGRQLSVIMVRDLITDDRAGAPAPARFRDHAGTMITGHQPRDHEPFLRDHEPRMITETWPGGGQPREHDHGDLSGGTSKATASMDRRQYHNVRPGPGQFAPAQAEFAAGPCW